MLAILKLDFRSAKKLYMHDVLSQQHSRDTLEHALSKPHTTTIDTFGWRMLALQFVNTILCMDIQRRASGQHSSTMRSRRDVEVNDL